MELSEEEKKAIEWLEKANYFSARLYAPTILNLINNYKKEIEDLKETNNDNAEKSLLNDIFIKKNYISKDKIREKLKEVQETMCPNCCACGLCDEFKELLEGKLMSEEEKKIIDRINRSYDDNTQYVEASAKDWNYIVHSIRKLHEEIEEKSTIIMAGAEKVKQLEKGNRSLMESRIKWKNRYYRERAKNKKLLEEQL